MNSIAGKAETMANDGPKPSVAVIGAGMAGLAAGRIMRDEGLDVTIFESSHHVGGVWRHSSSFMYRSLVTNLPKECMSYIGFPFPDEVPSFPTHSQLLDYLCSYAEQYDIRKLIRFGCPVISVRQLDNVDRDRAESVEVVDGLDSLGTKWEVVYRRAASITECHETGLTGDVCSNGTPGTGASPPPRGMGDRDTSDDDMTATRVFDAVCVCNGKFVEPFTPEVAGVDEFRGTVMHAREYDRPNVEAFEGRRVLCVGAGFSARDIAREVSSVASLVHVSDRRASSNLRGGHYGNIWWRPALERFEGPLGARFIDGESVEVDTVVWCTGYNHSFPFLEGSGLLTPPVSERVHPLYEHVFHVQHPSLSFIALPLRWGLVSRLWANAVAAVISGRAALPSQADREEWLLEEERTAWRERGVDPASRGIEVLAERQWKYNQRLLQLAAGPGVVAKAPKLAAGGAVAGTVNGHDTGQPASSQSAPEQNPSSILKVKEAIWFDMQKALPTFPGDPDNYRLREYNVDWTAENFSLSFASRKANGEEPCSTEATVAPPSRME